jgi:hypothetical protein
MYQDLLREHIEDKKRYGESPQAPCSPEALGRLGQRAQDELGVAVPQAYLDFLALTNGLDSNGLVIYAAETCPVVGYEDKDMRILGLVEANQLWWDSPPRKGFLAFGDSSMDVYVYDIAESKYRIISRQGIRSGEEFPSFEAMLHKALEAHRPGSE